MQGRKPSREARSAAEVLATAAPELKTKRERAVKYSRLITLAASVIVIASLYLARGVLIPFALAMLVSFLLAPLVLRLQRWRFSRVAAVATAMLLVSVASGSVGWLVASQVREVTTRLSEYKANIQEKVATLRGAVAQPVQAAMNSVMELGTELTPAEPAPEGRAATIQTVRVAEPVRGTFEILGDAFGPTLEALTTAALALLFAFAMLLRRDDLGDRFMRIVGHGQILVTTRALEEAAQKVSSYLWRLVLLNGLHGLAVGLGLLWIGVPNALLWGILAAILRFLPYVGPWIAATFPVLVALAVSPGWSQPLLTIGWFVLLELVSNNLLEPWIYGVGTGISPLAILVSALFWTWLWGPVGLASRFPELPIVAGMWTLQLDAPELAERLPILAGAHVVTSLGEARTRVRQLAEAVRAARVAKPAPVLAGAG